MDYASGNYYGKYLIRAYYFNKMPEYLRENLQKIMIYPQILSKINFIEKKIQIHI